MELTKTSLTNGIWEGTLTGPSDSPQLQVTHQGTPVDGLTVTPDGADTWRISFTIPAALISDGIQSFIISNGTGQTLHSIDILAGDALAEDIRAEVNLLRDELNMLKKAFRQHCQDSQGEGR